MEHTLTTGRSWSSWPLMHLMLSTLCMELCLIPSTLLISVSKLDLISKCNNTLYTDPASGAADDWYKGVLGSRFAFTTELRDTGRYGFILPPDQIIPSGEEMWAAMEVVIAKILSL